MRLLLDTHVAIWAINAPHRLPKYIQDLFLDVSNEIHISAVNVWEIAIKRPLGKASAPNLSAQDAIREFRSAGYQMLGVTADHAASVETLPRLHNDPFDRLLVAQALSEPMRLVSRDQRVAAYSDTIITW